MATHKEIVTLAIQGEYISLARAIKDTEDVSPHTILRALEIAHKNGMLTQSNILMGRAEEAKNHAEAWLALEADSLK